MDRLGSIRIALYKNNDSNSNFRAQEVCESRGGRPGLPSLISPTVSVDVKQHSTSLSLVAFELVSLTGSYTVPGQQSQ